MSDEREELEHRFASLRKELKGWERLFGRANGGKRPTREDIKANPDIALKYKEYDKIRDALAGKANVSKPPKAHHKRKRDASISEPSSKSNEIEAVTPKRRNTAIEPEQAPQSPIELTPTAKPTMIGPTPQRDGKFLGMFDLLSPERSSKDSRAVLEEVPINIATPSKLDKHSKSLDVATPARGSRTPASSGQRLFFENFVSPRERKQGEEGTLLSSRKLFATPSYLRRDTAPLVSVAESPEAPKVFRRRPFGRSLSSRMEELRREKEAENEAKEPAKPNIADDDYEDDLEAMREMEGGHELWVPTIVVKDSNAGVTLDVDGFVPSDFEDVSDSVHENGGTGTPKKPWKKKGLKRQTKRVVMKPVQRQASKAEADGDETATTGPKKTSKTSATAHANFRKLKIKNKNSKGKGRFGRRRLKISLATTSKQAIIRDRPESSNTYHIDETITPSAHLHTSSINATTAAKTPASSLPSREFIDTILTPSFIDPPLPLASPDPLPPPPIVTGDIEEEILENDVVDVQMLVIVVGSVEMLLLLELGMETEDDVPSP